MYLFHYVLSKFYRNLKEKQISYLRNKINLSGLLRDNLYLGKRDKHIFQFEKSSLWRLLETGVKVTWSRFRKR
jgi:hypothetical protein